MSESDLKDEASGRPVPSVPPELAGIVRTGVRANREVPGSVALGGTICSLYAGHRQSIDIDFVVSDLMDRFDQVQQHLQDVPGWRERKVVPPVLILGSLDGVDIGMRQLRRKVPLETMVIRTPDGALTIPTLEELIRVKAFLAYQRNRTRDYVDFAELSCLLAPDLVLDILAELDQKIGWEKQPAVAIEVAKSLVACEPQDDAAREFAAFKFIRPRFKSWPEVQEICREYGRWLALRLIGEQL